ncbi:MAG: type II toxin-antitoxin system death-on-curing family toxin [Deltaproteobacteria bacterium]|nr:type II toxin-antitoxin system death-on-curing family toxin [Deltaproteobacteria bacterium]
MRYLTLGEVVALQRRLIAASGGASGIRDLGVLESAVAQPRASFGGDDLYPGLIEKTVALGFSLVMGHPFLDGNKRTGHAAMETFLVLNGYELSAPVDEQARVMLELAAGERSRDQFLEWVRSRAIPRQ